jgi:orotate phosphoribosyltransferase
LRAEYQMQTFAIVTIEEIMTYLHNRVVAGRVVLNDEILARMKDYRAQYGGTE